MRLDFATLAFGYKILAGGGTPNWATSLGQSKGYKINNNSEIHELLKGMIYCAVSPAEVSTKIGKGGRMVSGNEKDSPIINASVFEKVYVNDTYMPNSKFVLLITRDTSKSHAGRLRVKYGPSNTYAKDGKIYSNELFFKQVRSKFGMEENACWFISEINVRNQDELILKTIIVNKYENVEYPDTPAHHAAWEALDPHVGAINEENNVKCGENIILYGVPGCGKSHTIKMKYCDDATFMERIVFHPDYTYSDFVGQILPRVVDDKLKYVFVPGPFTKILKKAADDPKHMYYLVIEEINRGNAPAIFGDIFQLLDRDDDGAGKYYISNYDMAKEVYEDENHVIQMPANLTLLATMNTSDQNVFTLDTAFQRRWEMRHIKNDISKAEHANCKIEGSTINWGNFAKITNTEIIRFGEEIGTSEDKRLGAYFARVNELSKNKFPEKVLKYLWDDAFKMDRYSYFNEGMESLDSVIDVFHEENSQTDLLKRVLKYAVYLKMIGDDRKLSGESSLTEEENINDQ